MARAEGEPVKQLSSVRRPQPIGKSTEHTSLIALDCEMVGVGAWGGESRLASVSIINAEGNEIYFSYAKPPRPVTDYRTKWSGIERKHLVDAPPAKQVQEEVRKICDGRVVVGHSLDFVHTKLGNKDEDEIDIDDISKLSVREPEENA